MNKKEEKSNVQNHAVSSGISSAAGSTIGVMIGSNLATVVNGTPAEEQVAYEPVETETLAAVEAVEDDQPVSVDETGMETHEGTVMQADEVTAAQAEEPEVDIVSSEPDNPVEVQEVEAEESEKPRYDVVSYETVMNDAGSLMDVAIINAEGQNIGVIDVDRDGVADYAMSDLNGNGVLDVGEVADISEAGVSMQTLQNAMNSGEDAAGLTAEIDYVNDANVDAYYA